MLTASWLVLFLCNPSALGRLHSLCSGCWNCSSLLNLAQLFKLTFKASCHEKANHQTLSHRHAHIFSLPGKKELSSVFFFIAWWHTVSNNFNITGRIYTWSWYHKNVIVQLKSCFASTKYWDWNVFSYISKEHLIYCSLFFLIVSACGFYILFFFILV